jgi:hypothetical protein
VLLPFEAVGDAFHASVELAHRAPVGGDGVAGVAIGVQGSLLARDTRRVPWRTLAEYEPLRRNPLKSAERRDVLGGP